MKNISIQKMIKQKDNHNHQKTLFTERYSRPSNQDQLCTQVLSQNYPLNLNDNKENVKSSLNQRYRYSTEYDTKQNTFEAAKHFIQKENKTNSSYSSYQWPDKTQHLHFSKRNPKFNFPVKSNNFQKGSFKYQDSLNNKNCFDKKKLKTQIEQQEQSEQNLICKNLLQQSCQFIKSEVAEQDGHGQDVSSQAEQLNFKVKNISKRDNYKLQNQIDYRLHQSVDLDINNKDRPITFGIPNKNINQITKVIGFPKVINRQKIIKKQIIQDIIQSSKREMLRPFLGSCQFNSSGPKCINHSNKKAKYILLDQNTDQQEQNYYCSKCAVNLAKRGFEIQQIANFMSIKSQMISQKDIKSKLNATKRQNQLLSFENRIINLEQKLVNKINQYKEKGQQMIKIDRSIENTARIYDQLISILIRIKSNMIKTSNQKNKIIKLDIVHKKQELSKILENTKIAFRQLAAEKHQILQMKNNQFDFLLNSFSNKISTYEEYLEDLQRTQTQIKTQPFDTQKQLEIIFQEAYKQYNEIYDNLSNSRVSQNMVEDPNDLSLSCHQMSMNQSEVNNSHMSSKNFYCQQQEGTGACRQLFMGRRDKNESKQQNCENSKRQRLNEVKQNCHRFSKC